MYVNNVFQGLIRDLRGPMDFVQEFKNRNLIGPETNWSNIVTVERGGQNMGTVNQFKDDNDVVQYNR